MNMEEFRSRARQVVNDPALTYHQRKHYLAVLAEGVLEYPTLSEEAHDALNKRIICGLIEGPAPYRGRNILPDYAKALRNGSAHLESTHQPIWMKTSVSSSSCTPRCRR